MSNYDLFTIERNTNDSIYRKPVDPKLIKKDPKGNRYLTAYDMATIADEAFDGKWSMEVEKTWKEEMIDYDIVYFAQVKISVPGMGSRTAIGGTSIRDTIFRSTAKTMKLSEVSPKDLQPTRAADMYKYAVSDGMKKALSYFFIGEEVYRNETHEKLELNTEERGVYGPRATPKVTLNELNKSLLKGLMKKNNWRSNADMSQAIIAANLDNLDDNNFEKFIKHHMPDGPEVGVVSEQA